MPDSSAEITVLAETEASRAWEFDIQITSGRDARTIQLRLDWTDYDHWSRGRISPSDVAAGALRCAIVIAGLEVIRDRVDASSLRRLAPGLDERVGDYLKD